MFLQPALSAKRWQKIFLIRLSDWVQHSNKWANLVLEHPHPRQLRPETDKERYFFTVMKTGTKQRPQWEKACKQNSVSGEITASSICEIRWAFQLRAQFLPLCLHVVLFLLTLLSKMGRMCTTDYNLALPFKSSMLSFLGLSRNCLPREAKQSVPAIPNTLMGILGQAKHTNIVQWSPLNAVSVFQLNTSK